MNDPLKNPFISNVLDHLKRNADGREVAEVIAKVFVSESKFCDMSSEDQRLCLKFAASQAESEGAFMDGFVREFGETKHIDIHWYFPDANDHERLSELYEALGGLVSKNGALVRITIDDTTY